MSRYLLAIVVFAGLVAPASAEIRIWFTSSNEPYGLTDPGLAFKPSVAVTTDDPDYSNNVDGDYYHVAAFPTYSTAIPTIDPFVGEFAYIWLQFGPGEAEDAFLHELGIGIRKASGPFAGVETSFYLMDNRGIPGVNTKRWAGPASELDDFASFRQNPQLLAAGTPGNPLGLGLRNLATSDPYNLYYAGGPVGPPTNRIYLLGAARPHVGNYGLFSAAITTFDNEFQMFVNGVVRDPASVVLGSFEYPIPEPATALTLMVLGLFRRR